MYNFTLKFFVYLNLCSYHVEIAIIIFLRTGNNSRTGTTVERESYLSIAHHQGDVIYIVLIRKVEHHAIVCRRLEFHGESRPEKIIAIFYIRSNKLTLKAPPIICNRRQFQILLLFQK